MTEAEWLACESPDLLLYHLRGNVSARKRRLFALACCRRIANLLPDGELEAVERNAEEGLSKQEHEAAWTAVGAQMSLRAQSGSGGPARFALYAVMLAKVGGCGGASAAARNVAMDADPYSNEGQSQCSLLRDIVGNPFRPVSITKSCLTPAVVRLAGVLYDERAFDRMPQLAEALNEAGCNDQDILQHCLQQTGHVRGCWVVDLILSKDR